MQTNALNSALLWQPDTPNLGPGRTPGKVNSGTVERERVSVALSM